MTKYKASTYVYSAPLGEDTWVWMNGITMGAFKVNRETHTQVQTILANPNNDYSSEQELSLYKQLLSLGFLVPESFDEIGLLKLRSRIARYGNEGLGLGIMVTLNCNFACPYCYQWRVNKWLSHETQLGILNYVSKTMEYKRKLVIEWFGGEPLLGISAIKGLSGQFLKICEERKAQYEAGITTNGYLLTEQLSRELAQLGVTKVQVTIDGPPDVHNRRRVLKNGNPTFDVILKNLEGAVKYFPSVVVRVNLDKTNSDRFPELLTYLAPLKGRLLIGLAPVVPTRAAQRYQEFCLRRCDYLQIQCYMEQLLKDEEFIPLLDPTPVGWWKPRSIFCGAYQMDSYMIDPEGHLYKCVALAGEISAKIGTLLPTGEIVYDWDRLILWLSWEPFEDPRCSKCPVLPLCFGGCHADRLYPGIQGQTVILPCPSVREDLVHRLKIRFGPPATTSKREEVTV